MQATGLAPIHAATLVSDDKAREHIIQLLVQNGARVNATDRVRLSALTQCSVLGV